VKQMNRISTLVLFFAGIPGVAQTSTPAAPAPAPLVGSIAGHPGWPVAKPEDVKSPEAILAAGLQLYLWA
jgi:hypothetical protein